LCKTIWASRAIAGLLNRCLKEKTRNTFLLQIYQKLYLCLKSFVMQEIKKYVEENKERFLNELFELLRFPSVSADPKYRADVLQTADFVAQKLKDAGADRVEV
jgi:hypothetical protein